jgi:hypothetical protein
MEHLCPLCFKNPVGSDSFHLPIYENRVVDPDETDDWAGMPVCDECYLDDGRKRLNSRVEKVRCSIWTRTGEL